MKRIALGSILALCVACSGGGSPSSPAGSGTTPEDPASPGDTTAEPTPGEPSANEPTEPSEATGPVCGTRGAAPCAAGTFCDFPPGTECGAADQGGQCRPIPQICTREYAPVCGCDGQTYPTACTANAAGISVSHPGPC